MPTRKTVQCSHSRYQKTSSTHASTVGYTTRTPQQLFTAATGSRKTISPEQAERLSHFPAPLVLPEDELANDPRYPTQSYKYWFEGDWRNKLTKQRRTVYVAAPPIIGSNAAAMEKWAQPRVEAITAAKQKKLMQIERPNLDEVLAYMEAFFHGLPVKALPDSLEFANVTEESASVNGSLKEVELRSVDSKDIETISTIRVRQLPTKTNASPYRQQLSLNDMLDHAIAILPDDAYCLLLLVHHDLYEDEDDDFCCGRAYGGSRICIVSTAQYHPVVDAFHGVDVVVDEGHIWPGSHCQEFINQTCAIGHEGVGKEMHKRKRQRVATARAATGEEKAPVLVHVQQKVDDADGSSRDVAFTDTLVHRTAYNEVKETAESSAPTPLEAALYVDHQQFLDTNQKKPANSKANLHELYLQRVTLTASHELLHCFGLDHCVYYACSMQGTASMLEDSRQPPYLCPVCENKLAQAILGASIRKGQAKSNRDWWNSQEIRDWRIGRSQAILRFCEVRGRDDRSFASLAAWVSWWLKWESDVK